MWRGILVTLLAIYTFGVTVFAQTDNKFSFETSLGYHRFPGILFNIDKSVTKHPDSLSGFYKDYSFAYALNKRWSLSASFIDFGVSGDGEWARSSTPEKLKQNEVTGIITGRTKLNNKGLIFNVRKYFLVSNKTQPYFKVGGGIGWLDVKFNGKFMGYETESGMNFPVEEEANDRISRRIPLIDLEVGLRRYFNDHIYLIIAPYWNTGFGAKFGLGITF